MLRRIGGAASGAGFRVEARHCNPSGICHGGWLATFADVQLVRQAVADLGADIGMRTVSLTVDYLSGATLGEWVEGGARVVRATRTLAFVEGSAGVGDRPVLRMNAIFSLKRPAREG